MCLFVFKITPVLVRSSPINISPTPIDLSLRTTLDKYEEEFQYITVIELDCEMSTQNEYVNKLLSALGPIKIKIDIKNENKYEPEIVSYKPNDKKIILDEGTYTHREIAEIQGFDRDRFDPGRLEYYLIGNTDILEINRTTGIVYLTGPLDAEVDQPTVFFCFARDMAPKPFGNFKNSKNF